MKNITLISALVVAVSVLAGTAAFAINKPTPAPLANNINVTRPVATTVVSANTTTTTTTSTTTTPTPTTNTSTGNTTVVASNTSATSNLNATSNANCIVGTNHIANTSYCFDSTHIYGNFPQSTIDKCIKANGGNACSVKITATTKDGKKVSTYRYNYNFYKSFINK